MDDDAVADRLVGCIASNWREANLNETDRALCAYAEKLTLRPQQVSEQDVERLRQVGLDDRAIHDAVQVIGYFNYINRVADALHVEAESFIRPWEEE